MLYVVDASVAVKWFIPEPHSDKAAKLLRGFRNKQLDLTAPDHITAEVASALWKRSTLMKEMSESQAAESVADFMALGLQLHAAPSLVARALMLAAEEHHPIHDMLYIALALERHSEFITADETLHNKLSSKFSFIRWIGDLSI